MRKKNFKGRCEKRVLGKCAEVCRTYDAIQYAYADLLQASDEVMRNTLGHTDINAIKSYARLDVERLRVYALAVLEAVGYFAKFLSGGRENS